MSPPQPAHCLTTAGVGRVAVPALLDNDFAAGNTVRDDDDDDTDDAATENPVVNGDCPVATNVVIVHCWLL
jgi:hypothetical protein